ncbi:hypothetical protein HA402_011708 [Bradysia odoriphaga]|nr:hypothetical protein HA402_011708 [Bradysia odoriphaga]
MTYSRGSTFYDPDSYGMDTYYTQNEIEESLLTPQSMAKNTYSNIGSDVESELREIKMLLATDNYIVTEMSPEEFNTRHILYNRFRKWMLENDMKTGMFRKSKHC